MVWLNAMGTIESSLRNCLDAAFGFAEIEPFFRPFRALTRHSRPHTRGFVPRPIMTPDTVVVANPDAMTSSVGIETVILHFTAGTYFGLDEVGTRIWQLVQERRSVREIRDALLEEYDVDEARCDRAVHSLLASLAEHGLITVDVPSAA